MAVNLDGHVSNFLLTHESHTSARDRNTLGGRIDSIFISAERTVELTVELFDNSILGQLHEAYRNDEVCTTTFDGILVSFHIARMEINSRGFDEIAQVMITGRVVDTRFVEPPVPVPVVYGTVSGIRAEITPNSYIMYDTDGNRLLSVGEFDTQPATNGETPSLSVSDFKPITAPFEQHRVFPDGKRKRAMDL
jgi:hypothetical protein